MQITRQSEYAVKTLMELARLPFGETLRTQEISERQNIPEVFLKKTIQLLARGGLLMTQRGAQGGIRLSIPADQITIANVIEAVEGALAINPCLSGNTHCPNESSCQIRRILHRAQEAMREELSKETLQDIVDQEDG